MIYHQLCFYKINTTSATSEADITDTSVLHEFAPNVL